MKNLHKHPFSLSAFFLTVFVVSFSALLFSGEAFAQGKKGSKGPAPAPVPKTGQTISYAIGDDGDLQTGVPWPVPRFIDHGDGTVTDNLTKLMWTKSPRQVGQYNWAEAVTACNEFVFAGYDDWRLPNYKELLSLLDYGQELPALPPGHPFTDLSYSDEWETACWTSTTARFSQSSAAWVVFFNVGHTHDVNKVGFDINIWAWPVREAR